ncbi:MAG: protein-L-isoaspartate O-methyltransferase, partial [Anaerolineales bacterium]|nr:protein-L-isoaspartate O-methyltransferase [Anaerolineales bacterium]
MSETAFLAENRSHMVENQIARRGVRDERVLEAMRCIPRHCFVPREYQHLAYTDGPLPIGGGQTISQPYIVALMSELLELEGQEKVLEVGTGS